MRGNSAISLLSATNIEAIYADSIDYMFIDPPFGANIMYSELNSIWEGWLKIVTNNQTEAIVNEYQHKTLFEYQQLMNRSLGKMLNVPFATNNSL